MIALHDEMEIKRDEQQIHEGELDFDRMAQQIQNVITFKNLCPHRL